MIGQTILQYKILEKLGEGGMGVVYKAQDTRLDRFVALKFLPTHISQSEQEKSRFIQEAKSASALNHPNVCTIYGIDEYEGQQFIEMEFVDGMTLREKIYGRDFLNSSQLSIKQVIEYGIQIGEALQEAHNKGIIHRDIKSENIMVNSRNQIKVMDFGLAKLKGSLKLTRTSSTIGTLAYMSPEQIRGMDADARSDIFSFGVVLFEMATAKIPFRGEHEAAIMYSIVNEEPENISILRPDLPAELVHILKKTLEKDPEDRYQSMSEIIVDLRRLKKESTKVVRTQEFQTPYQSQSTATMPVSQMRAVKFFSKKYIAGSAIIVVIVLAVFFMKDAIISSFNSKSEKKIIVVLPFENLGSADKDYFVDGMTDEVTSRLSNLSGLNVIATSSANQYRKSSKTFKQIGDELGVNYILQGTVRWETVDGETRVRVNPSLIRIEDGTQAWSQSMESVLSSAFKLQADIAGRVAGALDVALGTTEKKSLETTLTENPEAYDYFLQASDYMDRSPSLAHYEIAEKLLARAIRLDPSFAAAYARLGRLHAVTFWFFYDRSENRAEKARVAAEKAIELAPQLSEAHEALGWCYYHTKLDYDNALREFNTALKLKPNNSNVYYGMAAVMRRQGNMRGSVDAFKKSVNGNPRAADIIRQLAETQTLLRDYQEADLNYDKALELTPDVTVIYWEKARNLILWKGDVATAIRIIEMGKRLGKVSEDDYLTVFMSLYSEILGGNLSKVQKILDETEAKEITNNQFTYYPTVLMKALIENAQGKRSSAKIYFDSAKIFLEKKLVAKPDDERLYSSLGIAYAGLGRREDAIRSGLRGVELLPVDKEAWRGSYRLYDLAIIYTLTGDHEKAIDTLERLLSIPSEVSGQLLKLESWWKPLQENKRFQKLTVGL